jgi:hypothetical protein
MGPDQGVGMAFEKRTRKFISGLDAAKTKAAADGIELTPEEISKLAMKKALGGEKPKSKKKKKGNGWPFLPGSFESTSR